MQNKLQKRGPATANIKIFDIRAPVKPVLQNEHGYKVNEEIGRLNELTNMFNKAGT